MFPAKPFIFLFVFLFSITNLFAADEGGLSAAFLNYCNSVRNYSLGRTGITQYADPSSSLENSALLTKSKRSVYLMYTQPFSNFDDLKYQTAYFNAKISEQVGLGLGFSMLNADNIEYRNSSGVLLGYYNSSSSYYSLGAGLNLNDALNFGASMRYIKEKIQSRDRTAMTLTAGLNYEIIEELSAALIIDNIIKIKNDYKFDQERENIPLKITGEAGYKILDNFLVNAQLEFKEYQDSIKFAVGTEYGITKNFLIRSGYNTRFKEWSAGLGINIDIGNFDYGFGKISELGNTHRFSLTFIF